MTMHRKQITTWAKNHFGDQVAPNGKPAWENFVTWFDKSKVVDDETGAPLMVYHGTKGNFVEFQLGRADRRDGGWFGDGFYLTASQDLASSYAMRERDHSLTDRPANVMPVYVRMSNPYRINLAELSYDEGSNFTKKYGGNEGFRKWLADNGYDGVIGYRDPEIAGQGAEFWEVVVFDPTQIKSATGNTGTFDPNSACINDIHYRDFERSGDSLVADNQGNFELSSLDLSALEFDQVLERTHSDHQNRLTLKGR